MRRRGHAPPRRGFAMLLVLAFLMLLFGLSTMAFRQIGTAVRLQSVHSAQVLRDEGSLPALAQGIALLETGFPPESPFQGSVLVNTSRGVRSYTVTLTSDDNVVWSVTVAPTEQDLLVDPLPLTFAP